MMRGSLYRYKQALIRFTLAFAPKLSLNNNVQAAQHGYVDVSMGDSAGYEPRRLILYELLTFSHSRVEPGVTERSG